MAWGYDWYGIKSMAYCAVSNVVCVMSRRDHRDNKWQRVDAICLQLNANNDKCGEK